MALFRTMDIRFWLARAKAEVSGGHPSAEGMQEGRDLDDARPELARSHVSYARLIEARSKRGRAREHLTRAIGMFREMGMAWDLTRAEQAR